MIKRLSLIAFFACAAVISRAQTKTFTLEECIQYAIENSVTSKNASLDEQKAKARVKEITGLGLPQISGSASATHNEKLPRFFMSYSANGGFIDFGTPPPGLKEGDVIAAPNFFQLKNSGDASVSASQLIFNGSYFVGLRAAKAYKDLAYKASVQTREDIVLQVTKAYYTVLVNKERSVLFDNNIARVDSLLRNTKALFDNGFAESIDVDRIKVQLNNLVTERDKFLNMNAVARELLKFQMNYPMEQDIDISGNIEDVQIDTLIGTQPVDYKNRPDYVVLEGNKALQELNIRNLQAESLPTLSAFGTFGYQTQSNTIGGIFKTNSSFESSEMIGPDKWYNYSLFGLSLKVPLFSGFQQSNKIKQQRYELLKIENNQQMLRASIDLQVRQNTIMFQNALKSLEVQRANRELAENVARVTKIKYEQGVGSNIEVIDAETSLKETQTNYFNALYDAIIAKVDLDKAYGRLVHQTEQK